MTAPGPPDRKALRAQLQDRIEEAPETCILVGLELAHLLRAWDFERTVPPTGEWLRGPSYWIHRVHQNIQGPIADPGSVHPEIAQAVLSMVASVQAKEASAEASGPQRST